MQFDRDLIKIRLYYFLKDIDNCAMAFGVSEVWHRCYHHFSKHIIHLLNALFPIVLSHGSFSDVSKIVASFTRFVLFSLWSFVSL